MKKSILLSATLALSISSFASQTDTQNRCIVQLDEKLNPSEVKGIAKAMSVRASSSLKHVYTNALNGFTINIPCVAAEAAFGENSNIVSMEEDKIVSIVAKGGKGGKGGGETTPEEPIIEDTEVVSYGTTRVVGNSIIDPVNYSGKRAWVIDSGIDLDHPDLNVDKDKASDFTDSRKGADDENGHGTHVAGTIGAKKGNLIGTVGVAPDVTVVPVKVLDRRGSGSISDVIAGIDYVSLNAVSGDCVNLSLGGGVSTLLDNALINAAALKPDTYFVVAAGNNGSDSNNYSPSRVNASNIYTISAVDINDNYASFSNYGTPVDYAAPGVNITSLWKSGGVNTISGTSMAAPHACAVLMLTNGNPSTNGIALGDPDVSGDSSLEADPIISLPQEIN